MSKRTRYRTDVQLIEIGRRYGADEVALEASEAMARWKRDLGPLASYGFGQEALNAFAADYAEHGKLRSARPEAVAEKKMSVASRDRQVSLGWAWVDRVDSTLGSETAVPRWLYVLPKSGSVPPNSRRLAPKFGKLPPKSRKVLPGLCISLPKSRRLTIGQGRAHSAP